ncbi:MAG: PTS fructose transporter subunit IIA, partial [Comamonadaceae bacterium]
MNAILLIAHAPLANALRQCALHVFPDCDASVMAIDVQPNLRPEETLGAARIALDQLKQVPGTKGVLVLADIFGA